jgi:4-hydroxy-tetrahydrodipicolinate reductase
VSGGRAEREPLAVALHGAGGRMGGALCRLLADDPDARLVAAWGRPGDPRRGRDVGEIHGLGSLGVALATLGVADARPAVVVDFSRPEALAALVGFCREERLPLVSGTTGIGDPERALAPAAEVAPVLWAPNFSPALAALGEILPVLARLLPEADLAVLDVHHAGKRDAPSGTALRLARLAGGATRSVSTASLRVGSVVGEHALYIEGEDERLEIWHRVRDRAVFARGALAAARWIVGRGAGLHRFGDVLRTRER